MAKARRAAVARASATLNLAGAAGIIAPQVASQAADTSVTLADKKLKLIQRLSPLGSKSPAWTDRTRPSTVCCPPASQPPRPGAPVPVRGTEGTTNREPSRHPRPPTRAATTRTFGELTKLEQIAPTSGH